MRHLFRFLSFLKHAQTESFFAVTAADNSDTLKQKLSMIFKKLLLELDWNKTALLANSTHLFAMLSVCVCWPIFQSPFISTARKSLSSWIILRTSLPHLKKQWSVYSINMVDKLKWFTCTLVHRSLVLWCEVHLITCELVATEQNLQSLPSAEAPNCTLLNSFINQISSISGSTTVTCSIELNNRQSTWISDSKQSILKIDYFLTFNSLVVAVVFPWITWDTWGRRRILQNIQPARVCLPSKAPNTTPCRNGLPSTSRICNTWSQTNRFTKKTCPSAKSRRVNLYLIKLSAYGRSTVKDRKYAVSFQLRSIGGLLLN